MKIFTSNKDLIHELSTTKDTAKLLCKPGKSKAGGIREQAKRAGFKITLKQLQDGYEVTFKEEIPPDRVKAAINRKTKINTRHQASYQEDCDPADPRDPTLHGMTLREIMTELARMGGGRFNTQCKVQHIHNTAKRSGVQVRITSKDTYREVEVILP